MPEGSAERAQLTATPISLVPTPAFLLLCRPAGLPYSTPFMALALMARSVPWQEIGDFCPSPPPSPALT